MCGYVQCMHAAYISINVQILMNVQQTMEIVLIYVLILMEAISAYAGLVLHWPLMEEAAMVCEYHE